MIRNDYFLDKAYDLKPELWEKTVSRPGRILLSRKGDRELFDFGEHLTGKVSFSFDYEGHHPDAPVWLRLRFAERLTEFSESPEDYHGWISTAWIQQEDIHVDVVPGEILLPRRYAFRYMQAEILGISSRYSLKIRSISCHATTSADESCLQTLSSQEPSLIKLDQISCRTLKECMQDVFEDGPKRDRRLWMGDLRLQALTNYVTYRNMDLVKRCLYLFAGSVLDEGGLAASIFTEPTVEADDQYMFDYALLYAKTLEDYYLASGDQETLSELWPTVREQFVYADRFFAPNGSIAAPDLPHWCFVDWNLQLQKDTSALGIWLYCAEAAEQLAAWMEDQAFLEYLSRNREARKKAGQEMYDADRKVFVSGKERQISMSSQVWAVLGGLTDDPEIFARARKAGALKMVSPYMFHYYAEALLKLGQRDKALDEIRTYWGGMMKNGADTFWELYDPEDPDGSPYGGTIVNSYCHAWSCTPAYFLRTLLRDESRSIL